MEAAAPLDSPAVLRLVEQALNEFDSVPLPATIRRTTRIASLLGESKTAVKLGLELRASGGQPSSNAEMTRRLMADPDSWGEPDSEAEAALNEWMAGRELDDGKIAGHSLGTLLFWDDHQLPDETISATQYQSNLQWTLKRIEILERIRHEAFTSLCQWERRLSFAVTQRTALDEVSARVDSLMSDRAPSVLEQFNVAFRRLREADADEVDGGAAAAESLSQCLTSCRRILKAVVDVVQPVDPLHMRSADGHSLTDDKYKNRLFEYLRKTVRSKSYLSATEHDAQSLHDRFDAVDSLSSKGVHARVARSEAEFVALHTYLLAGQILAIAEAATLTAD